MYHLDDTCKASTMQISPIYGIQIRSYIYILGIKLVDKTLTLLYNDIMQTLSILTMLSIALHLRNI